MGSQRVVVPAQPGSRRARREAERRTARANRPGRGHRLVRAGVLAALVGTTIVVPLADGGDPGDTFVAMAQATDGGSAPTAVEALTATPVDSTPPAALASASLPLDRSGFAAASRSEERSPLAGCDGSVRPAGANGELDPDDLCTLWDGAEQLRADAATALAEMNLAYRARFGRDLCVVDSYRTLAEQHAVKQQKGGLAAVPGRSNHGWALAIDLCSTDTQGESWDWLVENGSVYGWENPPWAQRSGSGPFEPWHWEYTRGVLESGEHFDR